MYLTVQYSFISKFYQQYLKHINISYFLGGRGVNNPTERLGPGIIAGTLVQSCPKK